MSYLDFELEIAAGSGREYPVTVVRSVGGEVHETMLFPFDELVLENHLLILQNALLRSGGRRRQIMLSEEQAVQNFGRALFDALFIREVRSMYATSQREAYSQGKGLRLKLHIQSPELAALPWEFLYDPDRATYVCLSSSTPIVRYLELPQPPQPLAVTLPLRVLGMIASPKNLANLDVDNEKLRIEKATEDLRAKGLCEVTWLEGKTWHDLQRAMRRGPWHIFHFIGHGGFDSHAEEGLIALEDNAGEAHFLTATKLGRLLADHRSLRLVILNSCEGGRGSARDIFSSTAALLVRQGIPAVLAMQYEITDRAAIELSHAFYEALTEGMAVDTAVSEARKAISIGVENTVEWGTPVLYMRSPDGILFDLIEKAHSLTKQRHDPPSSPLQLSSMNTPTPRKAIEIFYSYAHKDERLKEKLDIHLSLLKQEGLIMGWYDREIRAGAEWASEIEAHLNSAHIILLLISPDFMASDYCYSIEMKRALERHDAQEAHIIPVILRPTDWERAPFGKLQALPTDRRPITRWSNRDEAFLHVAQDIRKVVDELNAKLVVSASSQDLASGTADLTNPPHSEQVGAHDMRQAVSSHTKTHALPGSTFLFNQPLPDPGEFYGRVRERETLLNRTRNGASTSIVGPRRIGKTWLMSYLKLVARKELGTRYLLGYLDAATARCATVMGFAASSIEAWGVERRTSNDADGWLALLEQVVQELTSKNQVPALCIDEFEGFGNRQVFDLHFFTALRAMTQIGLCLVVASKIPLIDFISDYGKTSGFFNVFEQLMIRPFSRKEAERFLQSKGTEVGVTERELERLLPFGLQDGEYWPVRLQLAGKMLLEDKLLAEREHDQDYYQPEDPHYWQEFDHRFKEIFQHTGQYLLAEPCTWLFYCFFQPARFGAEYERQALLKRFLFLLRLALPLFLFTFPLTLALHLLLTGCFLTCTSTGSSSIGIETLFLMVQATFFGIGCGIIAGVIGDVGLGIILSLALGMTGIMVGSTTAGFSMAIAIGVVLGIVGGTGRGQKWGIKGGVMGSLVGGLGWAFAWSLVRGTTAVALGGFLVVAVFLASYLLGYYRLLLYPVSGTSAFRSYRASRKNPLRVFAYLHGSSLYWDECVFLPLPYLQETLLIAVEQDVQLSLKEIAFIIEVRPQQRSAALKVSMEVALRDLEMRESMRDIARASGRLGEILPQAAILANPRWVTPFARLSDASREAARYCGPLSRQTRRHALEEMLARLESIYPTTAFSNVKLNRLLGKVVTNWRVAARYEQEKLEQGLEGIGQIDNPYNPGQVLKPHDPLFVGRRDIVRQLSESLGRGDQSPTFLLNGERRMGKSSTLKQLPNLLGATYIPIVFDLQARGFSSSIDVFLGKLAEEIYKAVSMRGMLVEKLERLQLQQAIYRNDAAAYLLMDEWLDVLERVLEREGRIVLLLFDEFEKLEESGLAGYLDLNLLLDWFRSTVQNRSHIALLFSGVQTFSELGTNWAGYFVNAKALKVSFLHPAEARHLILSPTPNFPGHEIFSEEVVQEIMFVTGCHPFLVQALCSELIEYLNIENRMRAEMQDIAPATAHVLDNWWDTYFRDLWERSDQYQRSCLTFLNQIQETDIISISQQCGFDSLMTRRIVQTLLERDLVLFEKGMYRIAASIFSQWVARNT